MDFVDELDELTDDEWDGLDPLELFLGSDELIFQILLLILKVIFLDLEEIVLLF